MPRQRLNQLKVIGVAPVPTAYRASRQRQMRIRDYLFRVEKILGAESVASGTGADRTVEREQPRLKFAQGIVADGAGEFVGEVKFRTRGFVHIGDTRDPLAQPQGGLERFCQ